MKAFSFLKLRYILYLTNVHFTLRPFYSRRRSPQYPLTMLMTGPQTKSDNSLAAYYVFSKLTQPETCEYRTLIKSRNFSVFSVPYCDLLQNNLIRIFLCNTIFFNTDVFFEVRDYFYKVGKATEKQN